MEKFKMFQAQELKRSKMNEVRGGFSILRIRGWFDGEKGSECTLFNRWTLWDTY